MEESTVDKIKNIGIYGGTFDPVHLGHINLAYEMMQARGLDEVWFCPAYINPFKEHQLTPAPAEHRLEMLKMVIKGEPRFHINDVELRRGEPSYTIDTLRTLIADHKGKEPPVQFHLIMGEDAARCFHKWRDPEEIASLARILTGRRSLLMDADNWKGSSAVREALRFGCTMTRVMEISGTEIRDRLTKGLYCGHLLQEKVLEYIIANHLYST